jgi:ATP-binding cassette, subfamily C (CFTR/MRP), member 1
MAARKIHNSFLTHIILLPMSFFDTTPNGRILSRIGKDLETVDQKLSSYVRDWLVCFVEVTQNNSFFFFMVGFTQK